MIYSLRSFVTTVLFIVLTSFCMAYETWMTAIPGSTDVYIVNPTPLPQEIKITSFRFNGEVLGEETQSIDPRQRIIWSSSSDVATTVSFVSSGVIHVDAIWEQGQSLYEQTGSIEHSTPQYFPHIAEQTDYWETKAWLTTGMVTRFSLDTQSERELLPAQARNSTIELNLEEVLLAPAYHQMPAASAKTCSPFPYSGTHTLSHGSYGLTSKSPQSQKTNQAWRMLQSIQGSAAGITSFHNQSGTQSATLPIHFIRDTYLLLPHIPTDQATWWTGLVLLNPGNHQALIEFTWYLDNGTTIETETLLDAGSKRSGLLDSYDMPVTAQWAEIKSSQAILGFELFGTRNEQSLCGLPLTNKLSKAHIFSRTGESSQWSGIAILNPGTKTLTITLNQYDHMGVLLRSDSLNVPAKNRVRFIPESAYPVTATQGSPWLELVSETGFSSFELVGKGDQSGLTALLGYSYSGDGIQLSYSHGIDENAWSMDQKFLYQDINFDNQKDFILSGTEGFTLITGQEVQTVSFEEIGFEAEGPLPTDISIADLNGDHLNEFMILDYKLHIFTRDEDQTFIRFQTQLPDLEGADQVEGLADANQDGFLDILTGRGYYKSLAALESPYFTNYFPFQLQTSGKASKFHDLNGDGISDLITSLMDSFYAFLSFGSTDDIGDPLYTPKEFEDILATFLKDMDGDGKKEVISLLGTSTNNHYGTFLHIADIGWESTRFLGEIPLPEAYAIGFLSLVEEPDNGTALFRQQLETCTRFIRISTDEILDIFHVTGFGISTDYNLDGKLDFVAPWAISITEPNTQTFNPAFLYFDQAVNSNGNGFFNVRNTLDWISYEEIAPGSAAKIRLWEETGFHRTLKPYHVMNLPISTPAFMELFDYDKDGDQDLLVSGSGLTVYKKTDQGYLNTPEFLHTPAVFTIRKAIQCDLNGNEYADLIGNHISGNKRLHIVFDYNSEVPISHTIDFLAEHEHILLVDLNGDGLNDLIVQNPKRDIVAFINSGANSFTIFPLPEVFKTVTTMDINGSGFIDIISYHDIPERETAFFRIYRNDGNLDFHNDVLQQIDLIEPYRRIIALDVNMDGKKDLLAFTQGDHPTMDIWLNQWELNKYVPFIKSRFTMINGSPHVTLRDRNTDGIPDLELQYNGVNTWRFNKTSYFDTE